MLHWLPSTDVFQRTDVNIFSHFSHPPLTTALSSHVVVVVTHGGTNHHTTQWNSDYWYHWSLKWVHFATNHEERHSTQGGWTYRNWWYNVRKTQTRFFLVFEILCGDCQVFQLQVAGYRWVPPDWLGRVCRGGRHMFMKRDSYDDRGRNQKKSDLRSHKKT